MREVESRSLGTFWHAVRIISLDKVSSAMVERVLSQLNFMCRTIGNSALEETCEARLMLRCNHHSFDDVDLD